MMQRQYFAALLASILFGVSIGCGGQPLIAPSRVGFPPWEKLPDGNGITYVNKYTHDVGIDPLYLASFQYDDDAALERVIQTFGLVLLPDGEDATTFTTTMPDAVQWFPLTNVTERYVYPDDNVEYVANIWVDSTQKLAIIERTWW